MIKFLLNLIHQFPPHKNFLQCFPKNINIIFHKILKTCVLLRYSFHRRVGFSGFIIEQMYYFLNR